MAGVDCAYHLAAAYEIGPIDRAAMERANVGGTRAFLAAADAAAVPRVIHVSSTAALGPSEGAAGDELRDFTGPYPTFYHRTKAQAHRLARAAQAAGAPVIIVCPANVYGVGDSGPNAAFMRDILRGRVPGLLMKPAWLSYVHVDDVVAGLVAAGDVGRTGAIYVLTGEGESVNRFAERVAALAGRRAPRLRFPNVIAEATGIVLDVVRRVSGLRFPMSREAVRAGGRHRWLHSDATSRMELGWQPRSLDEGLPPMVEWLKRETTG
jgi:nucleoside-diphosphate-sugar epimerase